MLRSIESETLAPTLQRTLVTLRRALAARRAEFSPDAVADLDVYLTVASRLLRSDDAGRHWQRLDVTGDFFRAVCFADGHTGYICGSSGTLLKTAE